NARRAIRGEIADETIFRHRARHRRPELKASRLSSGFANKCCGTRQYNAKFGEFPGLAFHLYDAGMLFDNNVVADRKAKPGALAGWFSCKERIEHSFPDLGRNAGAIVANSDFDTITEILCGRTKGRLIAFVAALRFALCRRVEAVRNQVEKYARNF